MSANFRKLLLLSIISISFLTTSQRAEAFEIHQNLGAGIGIPFGIFGVSYELEVNIIDSIAIGPTLALGTSILDGGASEVGLQLHFGHKDALLRYGLSYWSGTNTIIETSFENYETEEGETAGINLRIQFGSQRDNAIDVHILKILDPDEDEIRQRFGSGAQQGGDIKIGVGYVHRF